MNKEFYMLDKRSGSVFVTSSPENWKECEQVSKAEGKRLRAEHAKQSLLNILKDGDTVYTILRHVSASGMSRRIDLYTFRDNKPVYLSGYYAMMQGEEPPRDGYKVGGCGMDMGFHLVYCLSSKLYGGDRGGYELRHEWL
jgi:uncharacterized Zn ribbon protein